MINDGKTEDTSVNPNWAERTNAVNTTPDGFELVIFSNVEYTERESIHIVREKLGIGDLARTVTPYKEMKKMNFVQLSEE